jgi:hypothetical protein
MSYKTRRGRSETEEGTGSQSVPRRPIRVPSMTPRAKGRPVLGFSAAGRAIEGEGRDRHFERFLNSLAARLKSFQWRWISAEPVERWEILLPN